jgi:LEA14-like dessication related protein
MARFVATVIIAMVLASGLSSCRIQAPVFKGVENVQLERVGSTGIKIASQAVFYNPNRVRCKIKDIAFDVNLDKKRIATIGEKTDVMVKGRSDFRIPMGVTFNPSGTIFDNLKAVVDLFRDKESTLSMTGNIKLKAYFVTIPIPFTFEQKIKLSQLKK